MLRPVRPPVAPAAAALAAAALVSGCGSGPTDEQQVARTVKAFAGASAAHDYATLCSRILAPSLISQVTQIGLPCEKALERGLGKVRDPRLSIGAITVDGSRAHVQVRTSAAGQKPSSDTLQLVKVGGSWRIASLGR
jgi:Putative lumazine-binding